MDATILHLLLAVTLLLLTIIVGLASIKIVQTLDVADAKGRFVLSLLNCFAGGVFLGVCFLDMIPDVSEKYEEFIAERGSPFAFSWHYFFIILGFFLVYAVEEACFTMFVNGTVRIEHLDSTASKESIIMESGHSHNHSHDHHVIPAGGLIKSLTFAVAISFHSLLEGLALGVQNSSSGVLTLFISLLLHKAVEAFSVGFQVSKGNHSRLKTVIATVVIYSLMTPLGTVFGNLLKSSNFAAKIVKDGVILVLEALACGSFVYVTFLEVLAEEKESRKNNFVKLISVFIGFLVIALVIFTFSEAEEGLQIPCLRLHSNVTTTTVTS